MKYLIGILFQLLTGMMFAQQIKIGLLRDYTLKRVVLAYNEGSYSFFGDTNRLGTILPNEFIELTFKGPQQIELKRGVNRVGIYASITLYENKASNSLSITAKEPVAKERKYKNDFEITADAKGLNVINIVDFNNYLSGVVESEGGGGKDLEYYKVQALMSRTYALKYITKHQAEGFSLCDRVHCQAYHSMVRFTPSIDVAVRSTEGIVMEDDANNLVDAYFHANCGGQTSEAEYVWNNNVEYLNSFKDTFCIYTKQATWEKRIPQQKWADFLIKNYNYPINDNLFGPLIFTFNQPDRMAFYHSSILGIPLRDLRTEFGLRSTFFNTYPEGSEVVVKGRGYGHGVGLCQEGAMKMAKYGYNYHQIAIYYFPGIHLVKLDTEVFFKQRADLKNFTF